MKHVIIALIICSCCFSADSLVAQHKGSGSKKNNQAKSTKSSTVNTKQDTHTSAAIVDADSVQLVTLRKKLDAGQSAKAAPVAAAVIEDEGQKEANLKLLLEIQSEAINQLKTEINTKMAGINASKTLSSEQKKAKLAQYQEILQLKLTLMLGEDGYQYYLKTKGK